VGRSEVFDGRNVLDITYYSFIKLGNQAQTADKGWSFYRMLTSLALQEEENYGISKRVRDLGGFIWLKIGQT
jgi:hypothetical protein